MAKLQTTSEGSGISVLGKAGTYLHLPYFVSDIVDDIVDDIVGNTPNQALNQALNQAPKYSVKLVLNQSI